VNGDRLGLFVSVKLSGDKLGLVTVEFNTDKELPVLGPIVVVFFVLSCHNGIV
jgi:hypothetical protein